MAITPGAKTKLRSSRRTTPWVERRLALAIGLGTALRREDAVLLGRQHIRDGVLTIKPEKPQTRWRHTGDPVLPDLASVIDATPIGHLTLLTTQAAKATTQMLSVASFGNGVTKRIFRPAAPSTVCAKRR